MVEKIIPIRYFEFSSIRELETSHTTEAELLKKAIEATKSSYAPYSNFNVGAAVLLKSGEIVTASNQENAASPSGLCAERVAIFSAHSQYPSTPITAIAIAATVNGRLTDNLVYPCGACCQVMNESENRGGEPIKVIIGSSTKIQMINSIKSLLPFTFNEY